MLAGNKAGASKCKGFSVANQRLRQLGWNAGLDQQVTSEESNLYVVGRVCAHHGANVSLLVAPFEDPKNDSPNSSFKETSVPVSLLEETPDRGFSNIAVGDWFLLAPSDHRAVRRLDRHTLLARKAAGETVKPQLIAANVDTVFIVTSCNQEFSLSRLERYLALVLDAGAIPVVVLTKADLHHDASELRQLAEALHPGLIVETLDARDAEQAKVLDAWCGPGKTIALLGSSGVGKSTLANAMGGFNIKTAGIREDDSKGRHTTTSRSMHRLKAGGWLIDNPGMRELQLPACEQGVAELFEDVVQLEKQCKFRNCSHSGDAGCALEAAVAAGDLDERRMQNYLKLMREQARNSASLAERREKERQQGKLYKKIISGKKGRRGGAQ